MRRVWSDLTVSYDPPHQSIVDNRRVSVKNWFITAVTRDAISSRVKSAATTTSKKLALDGLSGGGAS